MLGNAGEVSYVLHLGLINGHTSVRQPAKTIIHELCVDNGYRLEVLEWWSIGTDSEREWKESVLTARLDYNMNFQNFLTHICPLKYLCIYFLFFSFYTSELLFTSSNMPLNNIFPFTIFLLSNLFFFSGVPTFIYPSSPAVYFRPEKIASSARQFYSNATVNLILSFISTHQSKSSKSLQRDFCDFHMKNYF